MLTACCRWCFSVVLLMPILAGVLLMPILAGCGSGDAPDTKPTGKKKKQKTSQIDPRQKEEQEGYFPLTLEEDFEAYPGNQPPAAPTWTVEGEIIKCSGDPRGYIYTVEPHQNFTLRFDYRFPATEDSQQIKKLNTGVLIYIGEEHKLWPVSLEVQGKHIEMGKVKANGGAPDVEIVDDDQARQRVRKPPGEWNSVQIVSHEGALTVTLNGEQVSESKPGVLNIGSIGFQSEGGEVHFRNMRMLEE